jgi:DNA-binding FadR family transcriptional regulator
VTPKRTFENISDQIKYLIYSKALKPQDRLPSERELATRFNAGRISVREALRILEESGFVNIKKGAEGGAYVKELDSTGITKSISGLIEVGQLTIQEIAEARISIESIILESEFKNITKEQLAALEANLKASEQLCDRPEDESKERRIEQLSIFHILLAETSKNRMYKYLVRSLMDLYMTRIKNLVPEFTEYAEHADQHRAIYKAIKAKNLMRAKEALKDHVHSITENIMRSTWALDR